MTPNIDYSVLSRCTVCWEIQSQGQSRERGGRRQTRVRGWGRLTNWRNVQDLNFRNIYLLGRIINLYFKERRYSQEGVNLQLAHCTSSLQPYLWLGCTKILGLTFCPTLFRQALGRQTHSYSWETVLCFSLLYPLSPRWTIPFIQMRKVGWLSFLGFPYSAQFLDARPI